MLAHRFLFGSAQIIVNANETARPGAPEECKYFFTTRCARENKDPFLCVIDPRKWRVEKQGKRSRAVA
jgi:hypothetical protein